MRKIIFTPLLLLSVFSYSQIEKENYKKVSFEFIKNYNESNYKAIFKMFDANMKAALPLEKLLIFLQTIIPLLVKFKKWNFMS